MISSLKKLYEQFIHPAVDKTDDPSGHSIQVATAALFVEMIKADGEIADDERKAVMQTIRSKFKLTEDEAKSLKELAKEKISKATDYYEFTSLIYKGLSYEKKVEIIENLWEIAFTDRHLDKHEEHMVRKISDLIYVEHKDFIEAKLRVKKRLSL